VVVIAAGVAATVAQALRFDDGTPCPDTQPLFVCPAGTVDSSYSIKLIGYGGCEPEFTFSVTNGALPPGLSLGSNGQMSGAPTTAGTWKFWVRLHDVGPSEGGPAWCTNPQNADREFSLTVNPRVLVTSESAPGATVGAPYTLSLTAAMKSGPTTTAPASSPFTWTIASGALPPGLSLTASTGVVSGTPTTEGSFLATYKAALVDGRSDTKTLEIVVRKPLVVSAAKPFATTPTPTLWEVGVPFASKLTPSGGSGNYTYAIASGSLPTGLALAADGTVSGTPRTAGVYRATLRLSDDEGRSLDYAANFGVAARLAVSTLLLKPGKVGKLYRSRVAATGGVLPKAWRITAGKLPKGVRFDRKLGLVSGTPTKAGRYRLTFQVTDGLKVVATKTLRIDVLP
jgi:Putative Ig domain